MGFINKLTDNLAIKAILLTLVLADRNGRAIATLLRLSSVVVVVCDVMYCG